MVLTFEAEVFDFFGGSELDEEKGRLPTAEAAADEIRRHSRTWRQWLQQSLVTATGAKLKADGKVRRATTDALASFQRARGLEPNGLVSPATLHALTKAGVPPAPAWYFERLAFAPPTHVSARCTGAGRDIGRIDDVLASNGVGGLPFEYVGSSTPLKLAGGLSGFAASDRELLRPQLFVTAVRAKLEQLVKALATAGLRVEALLTAGSFVQRCITGTNELSNHSSAAAFDLAGVRWSGTPVGALRETIVHNWRDPGERRALMQLSAILRLVFPTVLDFTYNKHHLDHFHVDLGTGAIRPRSGASIRWLREAMRAAVTGRHEARHPKEISPRVDAELRNLARAVLGAKSLPDHEVDRQLDSVFWIVTRKFAAGGV